MNNKDKIIKLELLGIILLIISLITDILELKSISVVIIIMSPLIIPAIYKEKEEKIENENIKVIKSIEDIEKELSEKKEVSSDNYTKLYEQSKYKKPPFSLLENKEKEPLIDTENIDSSKERINTVFIEHKIPAEVDKINMGPNFTQYEIKLEKNVRLDKIVNIKKELSFASGDNDAIIEIPIPGKNTIGITVKNKEHFKVYLETLLKKIKETDELSFPLGFNMIGEDIYSSLQKENSFLITGTVGTGKSMFLNDMLITFLYTKTPEELKMILIDPKRIEFSNYNDIPHLLTPVVTNINNAFRTLEKLIVEIEDRCNKFKNLKVKNIQKYNEYVENELKKDSKISLNKMPYILVIIDELSNLLFTDKTRFIELITKISSMSRTTGIYLIATTNQPYAVEKELKESLHSTISFSLTESLYATKVGILDANKLLGPGEMIYKSQNNNKQLRIQAPYISDEQIESILNNIKEKNGISNYSNKYKETTYKEALNNNSKDVLYDEILNYAIRMGQISASIIQRKYSIGYNRAARIIDLFEEQGIIGPANGSKPRDVLIKLEEDNNE